MWWILRINRSVLDRILQFPDVAGPRVVAQRFEHVRVQLRDGFAKLLGKAMQERVRQLRQILAPFAQRWDLDLKRLQPEYKSCRSNPS